MIIIYITNYTYIYNYTIKVFINIYSFLLWYLQFTIGEENVDFSYLGPTGFFKIK